MLFSEIRLGYVFEFCTFFLVLIWPEGPYGCQVSWINNHHDKEKPLHGGGISSGGSGFVPPQVAQAFAPNIRTASQ